MGGNQIVSESEDKKNQSKKKQDLGLPGSLGCLASFSAPALISATDRPPPSAGLLYRMTSKTKDSSPGEVDSASMENPSTRMVEAPFSWIDDAASTTRSIYADPKKLQETSRKIQVCHDLALESNFFVEVPERGMPICSRGKIGSQRDTVKSVLENTMQGARTQALIVAAKKRKLEREAKGKKKPMVVVLPSGKGTIDSQANLNRKSSEIGKTTDKEQDPATESQVDIGHSEGLSDPLKVSPLDPSLKAQLYSAGARRRFLQMTTEAQKEMWGNLGTALAKGSAACFFSEEYITEMEGKVNKLKETERKARCELASSQDMYNKLFQEHNVLFVANSQLKLKSQGLENEIVDLKEDNKRIQVLETRVAELTLQAKRVHTLETSLMAAKADKTSLEKKYKDLEKALSEMTVERDELRASLDAKDEDLAKLDNEILYVADQSFANAIAQVEYLNRGLVLNFTNIRSTNIMKDGKWIDALAGNDDPVL